MSENYDFKTHWETAYLNNSIEDLGWYEDDPVVSLDLINKCNLSRNSMIFHAGAGATKLIQKLKDDGYSNICVNDISKSSIDKLKSSISNIDGLSFVVDDLTNSKELLNLDMIDLWHDRAVLHFFIQQSQQDAYFNLLRSKVKDGGYVIFSEFAIDGAKKCCGLNILNYSDEMFKERLGDNFYLLESFKHLYKHPSNGNTRKYIYSLFKRKQ